MARSRQGLTAVSPAASVADLLEAPFVWMGKVDEIAIKLHIAKDVLGLSRYVIRHSARIDARLVIDAITGA